MCMRVVVVAHHRVVGEGGRAWSIQLLPREEFIQS